LMLPETPLPDWKTTAPVYRRERLPQRLLPAIAYAYDPGL
jgi:hypothetical protein